MGGKVERSRIPKSIGKTGATHRRGEFRRSVKPANSEGRTVRHCEVRHRFISDHATKGAWFGRTARYAQFYLEREGAGVDGERPEFFTADKDGNVVPADRKAFMQEAATDRYMLEVIIPPNDGDKVTDFKGLVAAAAAKIEQDLGTKLRWMAVVHEKHDAAHPEGGPKNKHAHMLVRGVDDKGHTLWISREYMNSSLRDVMQKELSANPTNEREKGWRLGRMSEREVEAFQKQMDDNRPARIARGWTKETEREAAAMTRTAAAEKDPAEDSGKERKRDRSRGAVMGEE